MQIQFNVADLPTAIYALEYALEAIHESRAFNDTALYTHLERTVIEEIQILRTTFMIAHRNGSK